MVNTGEVVERSHPEDIVNGPGDITQDYPGGLKSVTGGFGWVCSNKVDGNTK